MPGDNLHDGILREMFLDRVKGQARANVLSDVSLCALQHLDYLYHNDTDHDLIRMLGCRDTGLNSAGLQAVCCGFQPWANQVGRFLPPGDRRVNFGGIFSKLTKCGYDGWAVVVRA